MTEQLFLDYSGTRPEQLARRSDPATSKQAARRLTPKLGTIKYKLWTTADGTPRTARELAELAVSKHGGEVETFRKRAKELVDEGLLTAGPARECRHTGEKATTYYQPGANE